MDEIVEAVKNSNKITVFTGAGMSVESGIAPFRGEDGLWDDFDPQKVASASAFADSPGRCWKLFKLQIKESFDAEPHEGHYSLVQLEDHGLKSIITQNIDGLHQRAGSKDVLEIHGSLNRLICPSCQKKYDTKNFLDEIKDDRIPSCKCDSILRPDVVLFGEPLSQNLLDRSWYEVKSCDLLFTLGTSAVVQPAASLPSAAKKAGAEVVEINLEKTPLTDKISDYFIEGKVGEELPKLTARL